MSEVRSVPARQPRLTGMALMTLLSGLTAPIKLNFVGDIYVAELLLPLVAIFAIGQRPESRILDGKEFRWLLSALLITLAGYVLSDIVQGSRPDQFLRGWGRVLLVILDFLCLAVVVSRSRDSIWWFVLGLGVGGVLFLRLVSGASLGLWKFGYAEPMGFIAVAVGALLSWKMASLWLLGLGLKSLFSDYRSFGAICFLVAAYLWVRSARPSQPLAGGGSFLKLALAGGLALGVVMALLSATEGSASGRRDESNAGRRAAIEVGLMAIGESPVIGHGSWTENKELTKRYLERQLELRGLKNTGWKSGTIFNPHSQVLHAWVEGGVLGAVFFLALFFSLLKSTPWLLQQRPMDLLTPILLFFVIMTLWNLYMSPFAAPHRIYIAFGGILAVLLAWQRQDAAGKAPVIAGRAVAVDLPLPASRQMPVRKLQWRNSKARVCMRKTSGARMRFER